jgi:hypothetical protein|tara:strand:- start:71 stop:376 length:306 start_codon:yes stop_codon:yes gene_type:complete
MKRFFLVLTVCLFSSTLLFAEYRLEPVNCTLKKKSNCGAYLYNSSTGATYFCDSEKCKEVMAPIEEEVVGGDSGTKKSKIPKKPKKKKSKIPKKPKKKKSE